MGLLVVQGHIAFVQCPRVVYVGLYGLLLGLLPVQLLLISLGQGAQAMALNNLGMLCVTLWGGVVVWFASIEDRTLRLLFKTLSICLVAYLLLWLMPAIAPLPLLSNVSLYRLPEQCVHHADGFAHHGQAHTSSNFAFRRL